MSSEKSNLISFQHACILFQTDIILENHQSWISHWFSSERASIFAGKILKFRNSFKISPIFDQKQIWRCGRYKERLNVQSSWYLFFFSIHQICPISVATMSAICETMRGIVNLTVKMIEMWWQCEESWQRVWCQIQLLPAVSSIMWHMWHVSDKDLKRRRSQNKW